MRNLQDFLPQCGSVSNNGYNIQTQQAENLRKAIGDELFTWLEMLVDVEGEKEVSGDKIECDDLQSQGLHEEYSPGL